jgi:hypothetical protein
MAARQRGRTTSDAVKFLRGRGDRRPPRKHPRLARASVFSFDGETRELAYLAIESGPATVLAGSDRLASMTHDHIPKLLAHSMLPAQRDEAMTPRVVRAYPGIRHV